jgi:hypothetical protein
MDRRELLNWATTVAVSGLASLVPLRANAASAKKLLLVHGRGQQGLNPDALKTEWMAALERGAVVTGGIVPRDVDVAFPYYGDTLDSFTRQFGIPLTPDLQARGAAQDDEFLAFQYDFAEAVRQRAGITDAQVDLEYGNNPQARGPLNWQWVQAILRAIDKHGSGLSQNTLEAFTRDVYIYSTRAGVRDEVNRIVAGKLTEQPTVVVGHSLGSVVAYSVLRTDPRPLKVPLFVTVGSPLAVRAVRDQFRPLRSPPPVDAWYNAFDTRDVVALYPLDAENFPVQPAIENNSMVKNSTDNRHGIAGYLDDPEVAKRVLNALRG